MTVLSVDAHYTSSAGFRSMSIEHSGLHRLFTAAIVSNRFRKTLLSEPETALAGGYLGQTFTLNDHERKIIKTIHAANLTDFAQKINQALKE